jgi:Major Facilitator Superfamily
LALGAGDLGLLTSVYFLILAAARIPAGVWLNRFGPRRVQSALLLVAAVGAALFATSQGFVALVLARALIGLGVAAALTAGLKAIVLWFPKERVATVNVHGHAWRLGHSDRYGTGRPTARLGGLEGTVRTAGACDRRIRCGDLPNCPRGCIPRAGVKRHCLGQPEVGLYRSPVLATGAAFRDMYWEAVETGRWWAIIWQG